MQVQFGVGCKTFEVLARVVARSVFLFYVPVCKMQRSLSIKANLQLTTLLNLEILPVLSDYSIWKIQSSFLSAIRFWNMTNPKRKKKWKLFFAICTIYSFCPFSNACLPEWSMFAHLLDKTHSCAIQSLHKKRCSTMFLNGWIVFLGLQWETPIHCTVLSIFQRRIPVSVQVGT